jgi:hypothetical protein
MTNPKSEVRNPITIVAASRLSAANSKPGHRGFPQRYFCFLLSAFCFRALGQSYSIDWQTIDGGGGTSTGGVYSVTGTIGQPDAGTMSGGNFSVTGGFWGLYAVQTPGAPYLSVLRTSTNTVCVWWPVSETSWQLQATASLVTGSIWSPCSYVTNGANCVYIESPPAGNRFYRLQKP